MSRLFQVKSFIHYWLDAVDEHSLHSPFLYHFYTSVVKDQKPDPKFHLIETLRRELLADHKEIAITDLGAGSTHFKSDKRKISAIARTSISPARLSRLYCRAIAAFNPTTIVELGTSLGINSLYLAQKKESVVHTFEGSPAVSAIAKEVFRKAGAGNIVLHEGNIDNMLPVLLSTKEKIDFVLLDANHRFEPTMRYVNWLMPKLHADSVMVLDDIYKSEEMKNAWLEVCRHPRVSCSVDLFRCGFVFFDSSLNKQHTVLQFSF